MRLWPGSRQLCPRGPGPGYPVGPSRPGRERTPRTSRIEAILRQVLGGEPPPELLAALRSFNPAAFKVDSAAATLQGPELADKRKLLELIASVNDADEVLDLAEDAYLRHVAIGMGVAEAEIADLTLEVLEDKAMFGLLT